MREAIQNSLDAGPKGSNAPVRMRFALAGIHNPLPARYCDGLADHLTYINLTYINDLDESINDRKPQCNGPG